MIDTKDKLTVFHDDDSVFTEYTKEASNYLRDPITISLVAAEDYIYIGYDKPISAVYIDFTTVGSNASLTVEYYNGTTFTSIDNLDDDTKGFSRNGFIQWSRNQEAEESTEVNSATKYWYRIKPSINQSIVMTGISIVFNDLQDLKVEYEDIDLVSDETPTINSFVNARNNIIQGLRNKGNAKSSITGGIEQLSPWDILDSTEVRQAAVYFCMYKWFFHKSDTSEDVWADKSAYYLVQYNSAIDLARISLDLDDDGLADSGEVQRVSVARKWSR